MVHSTVIAFFQSCYREINVVNHGSQKSGLFISVYAIASVATAAIWYHFVINSVSRNSNDLFKFHNAVVLVEMLFDNTERDDYYIYIYCSMRRYKCSGIKKSPALIIINRKIVLGETHNLITTKVTDHKGGKFRISGTS